MPETGSGPSPRKLRCTGNRKTVMSWPLPAVLTAAVATQTRAIGTRRFVYLIIDPPTPELAALVKATDAKARLRLVPDATGNLPDGAKSWAEDRISDTLNDMKEQGFIDPRLLLDNRSEEVGMVEYDDVDDWLAATRADAENFPLHRQDGQPRRYEVHTEAADTLADLRDALEPYGVRAYSSSGSKTVGAIDRIGRRICADTLAHPQDDGEHWTIRETVIPYVGDGDPPGMSMEEKIENAAIWANRWWHELQYREAIQEELAKQGKTWSLRRIQAKAWEMACAEVGDDPGPFKVTVIRVAVTFDDLDHFAGASTVSPKVAEQYRRWWPVGEERTLQVEGLPVTVVVARVIDKLDELFDADALQAAHDREDDAHRRALGSIADEAPE